MINPQRDTISESVAVDAIIVALYGYRKALQQDNPKEAFAAYMQEGGQGVHRALRALKDQVLPNLAERIGELTNDL